MKKMRTWKLNRYLLGFILLFLLLPVTAVKTSAANSGECGYNCRWTVSGSVITFIYKTAYLDTSKNITGAISISDLSGLERSAITEAVFDMAIAGIGEGTLDGFKNLKKAFKWSARLRYRSNTNGSRGKKAARYYGKYGFSTGSGDCNTAAYTFYWMAKVLGYSPKVVQGHVPNGSMYNLKSHAWVTIKFKKKLFYFDPDLNRAYAGKTVRTASGWIRQGKYCGFKFRYGTPGTYKYMK